MKDLLQKTLLKIDLKIFEEERSRSLVSIHEFKMNTMGVQFRNEQFLF